MTVEDMVRKLLRAAIREGLVRENTACGLGVTPENATAGDMTITAQVLRELLRERDEQRKAQ